MTTSCFITAGGETQVTKAGFLAPSLVRRQVSFLLWHIKDRKELLALIFCSFTDRMDLQTILQQIMDVDDWSSPCPGLNHICYSLTKSIHVFSLFVKSSSNFFWNPKLLQFGLPLLLIPVNPPPPHHPAQPPTRTPPGLFTSIQPGFPPMPWPSQPFWMAFATSSPLGHWTALWMLPSPLIPLPLHVDHFLYWTDPIPASISLCTHRYLTEPHRWDV